MFGTLKREQGEDGNGKVFYYYVARVDLPPHYNVVLVLHFDENQAYIAEKLLATLEPRFIRLSREVNVLPSRAADKIHALFVSYYGEDPQITPFDLTTQLSLTYFKLIDGGYDELIYYGNDHYLSYDLNMAIDSQGEIVDVWFDG